MTQPAPVVVLQFSSVADMSVTNWMREYREPRLVGWACAVAPGNRPG